VSPDERSPDRSRLTEPAGESPAQTGTGASGSRPPARGEIAAAEAGRRKPLRREQERGPTPAMAVANNAAGGKRPWGEGAVGGGKREGMVQPTKIRVLVSGSLTGALSEGAVARTDEVSR